MSFVPLNISLTSRGHTFIIRRPTTECISIYSAVDTQMNNTVRPYISNDADKRKLMVVKKLFESTPYIRHEPTIVENVLHYLASSPEMAVAMPIIYNSMCFNLLNISRTDFSNPHFANHKITKVTALRHLLVDMQNATLEELFTAGRNVYAMTDLVICDTPTNNAECRNALWAIFNTFCSIPIEMPITSAITEFLVSLSAFAPAKELAILIHQRHQIHRIVVTPALLNNRVLFMYSVIYANQKERYLDSVGHTYIMLLAEWFLFTSEVLNEPSMTTNRDDSCDKFILGALSHLTPDDAKLLVYYIANAHRKSTAAWRAEYALRNLIIYAFTTPHIMAFNNIVIHSFAYMHMLVNGVLIRLLQTFDVYLRAQPMLHNYVSKLAQKLPNRKIDVMYTKQNFNHLAQFSEQTIGALHTTPEAIAVASAVLFMDECDVTIRRKSNQFIIQESEVMNLSLDVVFINAICIALGYIKNNTVVLDRDTRLYTGRQRFDACLNYVMLVNNMA